jgi:hypothetical protein
MERVRHLRELASGRRHHCSHRTRGCEEKHGQQGEAQEANDEPAHADDSFFACVKKRAGRGRGTGRESRPKSNAKAIAKALPRALARKPSERAFLVSRVNQPITAEERETDIADACSLCCAGRALDGAERHGIIAADIFPTQSRLKSPWQSFSA